MLITLKSKLIESFFSVLPIAIIGAVIGAGYLLIKNWDTVKEACSKLGEWIGKTWDNIKKWTSEKWSAISQSVSNKVNELKEKAMSKILELGNRIKQKWNNIIQGVINIVTKLVNGISNKITSIKNTCSRVFSQIKEILVAPFRNAKATIDRIIGGISSGISKVTGWLGGKGRSITIDTQLNTPQIASSFDDLQVQSSSMLRSGSITDSLKDLSSNLNKLDYYSNRYRASSDNNIARSISNNNNDDVKNELKQQNNLLTQLLNVMQKNNNDSGIHLNIENFNNNRGIDIKTLYEELEYYKYQSKLARGGV